MELLDICLQEWLLHSSSAPLLTAAGIVPVLIAAIFVLDYQRSTSLTHLPCTAVALKGIIGFLKELLEYVVWC